MNKFLPPDAPAMSKKTAMECAFDMAGSKDRKDDPRKPRDWSPFQVISALGVLALEVERLEAAPAPSELLTQRIKDLEADNKRLVELSERDAAAYRWARWAFSEIRGMAESANAVAVASFSTHPDVCRGLNKIIDKTMDIYKPAKHTQPAAPARTKHKEAA